MKKIIDDYTKSEILQEEERRKNIDSLLQRVDRLEKKFGDNEKIAKTLKETSDNILGMRTMILEIFTDAFYSNKDVKTLLLNFINQADRNWLVFFFRKFWMLILTLSSGIIGSLLTLYFQK